jgi:hypothetical protein
MPRSPLNQHQEQFMKTNPTITPAPITIETRVAAHPSKVWHHWVTSRQIEQWNAATHEWHCPRAARDLGPGGRFSHRMEGSVLTVEFCLAGHPYLALNGGPEFSFNEAVSFQIHCGDQAEVDRLWSAPIALCSCVSAKVPSLLHPA